jgi:hypothetical protein
MQAKEEEQELQQQLRQLQQEHDALLQRHTAATLHNPRHSATAVYCPSCQQLRSSMPQGNASSSMRASSSAGEPAAFAVQFSRALQIADADRNEAVRRAAAAEQVAAELRQQLIRQELELDHLHRCGSYPAEFAALACISCLLPLSHDQRHTPAALNAHMPRPQKEGYLDRLRLQQRTVAHFS